MVSQEKGVIGMLKIYIARHGQNEDNVNGILNGHRDLPLTKLGFSQANELASGILEAELSFDAIYSSPLSRAHWTAEIVAGVLGMPVTVLPELIERDFGIMTGKLASDIERLCAPDIVKTETITYFLSPEGAETFPMLKEQRGRKVLELIRQMHTDGSVLLVTHGDIGKMIYAAYYDLDWRDVLTLFHFGNSELILLAEDSKPEDAHVLRIAQHNH